MANNENNKIIIVNSFKGGCGKTSIALSLCATESKLQFREIYIGKKETRQILYIDVDILGTASEYSIYAEAGSHEYMNSESDIKTKTNFVKFKPATDFKGDERCRFTAMLLNPVARETTSYTASGTTHRNSHTLDRVFLGKLIKFLEDFVENNDDFFIVLDCSPGFGDFEKALLEKIHTIKANAKHPFDFIECFVTTLDKSHIEKAIASLCKITCTCGNLDIRNIKLLVNELINLNAWSKSQEGRPPIEPVSYLEKLCEQIEERIITEVKSDADKKVAEKKIAVIYNKYNDGIPESNLMFLSEADIGEKKNPSCLETNPDAYTNNKLHEGVV